MRYVNKRLTTDMADANVLQRAIRPTGFFNITKMAADFGIAQCEMDNTGSLMRLIKSKKLLFRPSKSGRNNEVAVLTGWPLGRVSL